ncbi:unnamed protein product [Strongylus vulgaris]|uniref:Uncharacterized protein n=1 Tax=Strongylus vulgaris TaxID=40348 RepID=A0A3P7KM33_STRVU|nr:unnamed protein product [Strongylus vulgaris]
MYNPKHPLGSLPPTQQKLDQAKSKTLKLETTQMGTAERVDNREFSVLVPTGSFMSPAVCPSGPMSVYDPLGIIKATKSSTNYTAASFTNIVSRQANGLEASHTDATQEQPELKVKSINVRNFIAIDAKHIAYDLAYVLPIYDILLSVD